MEENTELLLGFGRSTISRYSSHGLRATRWAKKIRSAHGWLTTKTSENAGEATFVAPPGSDRQLHYPFFHQSNVRKMINVIFNFHSSKIGKTTLISIICGQCRS